MFGFGVITLGAIGVLADESEEPIKTIHQYSKVGYTNTGLEFIEKNGKHVSTGELSDAEFRKIMKQKDIELAELEEKRKLELAYKKQIEEKSKVTKQAVKEVNMNISFYSADYASTGKHKGHSLYGITASGTKAEVGRTIACPKQYPFGTKMYIEGFGERVCEDRGGAIKGNKLDVFVATEKEAYALGRKYLKVRILN